MHNTQSSPEKTDVIRETIMRHAQNFIVTEGYDGFSIKKLATRLSITTRTIYKYFRSQDDLYLHLLIKDFNQLFDTLNEAIQTQKTPQERLEAIIRSYVNFGLSKVHAYSLMFIWHRPKHEEYMGTPEEETAEKLLASAIQCAAFFLDTLAECLDTPPDARTEELLRKEFIFIWSQLHGYVAGINSTLLHYLHGSPLTLKEDIITRALDNLRHRLDVLNKQGALKTVPEDKQHPKT